VAFPLAAPAPALAIALASPWDLELGGRGDLFRQCGTHQLGRFDYQAGTIARLAGSGGEAIVDGPEDEAALAQPSGLALSTDGRDLYSPTARPHRYACSVSTARGASRR